MPRKKKKTKMTSCPDCSGDGECRACDNGVILLDTYDSRDKTTWDQIDTCDNCSGSAKCTRCKGKGSVPLVPGSRR